MFVTSVAVVVVKDLTSHLPPEAGHCLLADDRVWFKTKLILL
jgi:hypothetical protein